MSTVSFFYLGCKVNHYECSALASLFKANGYEVVDGDISDVCVINTCAVTKTSEQKSRQLIRKIRNKNPNSIVVVHGCFSQHAHQFIKDNLPVDIILGTKHRDKILEYVEQFKIDKKQIVDIDLKTRLFDTYEELGTTSCSDIVRAYLKIQDGCDHFCSYCLIPFTRGKSRSRSFSSCLNEARFLVEQGYKEIVVTGIDVGSYKDGDYTFSSLIEALLNIPNLSRLRISSIEASQIDDKFLFLLKTRDNLAKHIHLSLQSGCNDTLKRMNRLYTSEEYLRVVNKIYDAYPSVAITTDVIVGFNGESEQEFNESYNFIKKCKFASIHVFPYSIREGTNASRDINIIAPKIKKERVKKLLELSKELNRNYQSRFKGEVFDVLFESYDEKDKKYIGHTSNYLEVKVESKNNIIGEILKVRY